MANKDQMKGRAKEAAGDLTDDDEMKAEGKTDRAAGGFKEKVDQAKDKMHDAVDSVKDAVNKK